MRAKSKLMQRLTLMRLDRKITVFLFVAVVITAVTLLVATTLSAARTVTRKSNSMAVNQMESVARNMEATLQEYRNLIMMLMLDDRVQSYLKSDPSEALSPESYTAHILSAYQSVHYMRNVHSGILYAAILREDADSFVYSGGSIYSLVGTAEDIFRDYGESLPTNLGTLRYQMLSAPGEGDEYILRLYQPLYDKNILDRELGLLCIGINESVLNQFCSTGQADMEYHIRLANGGGDVLYDPAKEGIGAPDPFADDVRRGRTNFTRDGEMVIIRPLGQWDFRLVGSISTSDLYFDSYSAVVILLPLISLITLVILFASRAFVRRMYDPLRNLVGKMKLIASGDLSVSMDEDDIGVDFREMVSSFNLMVVKLSELMEQVKEEERQAEQIRFNALQSQIQPHFLYNTLECIHWQSAVSGDRETSKMVKALATYYRICLSKGHDIIPLSQEITHIRSYLTIQNMRYDNIVEAQFTVEERFYQVSIPKMTLQPLVENSIYHGIKNTPGRRGRIIVGAREEGADVIVFIQDNGLGMSEEAVEEMNQSIPQNDESFGYGVRNVHHRIGILFGKGYGLHYRRNEPDGLTVEIRLPGLDRQPAE